MNKESKDMDKNVIINKIKQRKFVEIPSLQTEFHLSYIEAKKIVEELGADGSLIFESGIRFVVVKTEEKSSSESKSTGESSRSEKDTTDLPGESDARSGLLKKLREEALSHDEDEDEFEEEDEDEEDDDNEDEDDDWEEDDIFNDDDDWDAINIFNDDDDWDDDEDENENNDGDKDTLGAEFEEEDEDYSIIKSLLDDIDAGGWQERKRVLSVEEFLKKFHGRRYVPITADIKPKHPEWCLESFESAVIDRLERIVKSDKKMRLSNAVEKAETQLEAVRDTTDKKMIQVYERVVYELKTIDGKLFSQLKKLFFDE